MQAFRTASYQPCTRSIWRKNLRSSTKPAPPSHVQARVRNPDCSDFMSTWLRWSANSTRRVAARVGLPQPTSLPVKYAPAYLMSTTAPLVATLDRRFTPCIQHASVVTVRHQLLPQGVQHHQLISAHVRPLVRQNRPLPAVAVSETILSLSHSTPAHNHNLGRWSTLRLDP